MKKKLLCLLTGIGAVLMAYDLVELSLLSGENRGKTVDNINKKC